MSISNNGNLKLAIQKKGRLIEKYEILNDLHKRIKSVLTAKFSRYLTPPGR